MTSMALDDEVRRRWFDRQLEQRTAGLNGGGGDGTSGDMEHRVTRLETHMESVRADLAKLTQMPADLAALKERVTHLPTRIEVKNDVDAAVDRAGTRTQRTIMIVGGLVAVVVAALNFVTRL